MARYIRLTDGSGRKFNIEAAKRFQSEYYFDGHNMICAATNRRFVHETLYRTRKGKWVLHFQNDWQGAVDKWEEISEYAAKRWLKSYTNVYDNDEDNEDI